MKREYTPDRWVLVDTGNTIKVFATWWGSFSTGDSWKLSSGVKEINDTDGYWNMPQYSGSVYNLHKSCTGVSAYTNGVLASFIEQTNGKIKVITVIEAIKLLKEGNR